MKTLDEARAFLKHEESFNNSEIWEAILATHETIKTAGGTGLPELHVNRARANLIRAGVLSSGDFTNEELVSIATADGVRIWTADMGVVFKDEVIIGEDGETYIAIQQHQAQAGWGPGTVGGRTLFRLLRKEPTKAGTYLDFAWGERVAFGTVRRDPTDGKLYTPIKEAGVTLYEPHYPHLVPSEYKIFVETKPPVTTPGDDGGTTGGSAIPDWDSLTTSHTFAVGDHFTADGTEYEVLRAFARLDHWKPPALLNDYYKAATKA